MTVKLNVRVTSKSKCREGFYLLMNGERVRFARRAVALDSVRVWLRKQRIQIVTVREYQERNRKKISARMPVGSLTMSDLGYSSEADIGATVSSGEWVQFADPWKKPEAAQ